MQTRRLSTSTVNSLAQQVVPTARSPQATLPEGLYAVLMAALEKDFYQIKQQELSPSPSLSSQQGQYEASNRDHQLRITFTSTGLQVHPCTTASSSWQWGLNLRGYGYGNHLQPVPAAVQTVSDNRIERCQRPDFTCTVGCAQ